MLNPRTLYSIIFLLLVSSTGTRADTFKEGGDAYKSGDFEIAEKKFLEVAEKGDHRAMYALGSMYAGGSGVEKDYGKAYTWFSRAARYGRPDAQYKMGVMQELGLGVPQNHKRAARLYNTAAKSGYAHAQFKLGLMYSNGQGVKKNNTRAYAWLTVAQHNLAALALQKNMPSDTDKDKGDIFAGIHAQLVTAEMEKIKAGLTSEQLNEARTLAQEYAEFR